MRIIINKRSFFIVMLVYLALPFIWINAQNSLVNYNNIIRTNKKGLIRSIYNVDSKKYQGTAEDIARKYLNEYKNLFGLTDNLLDLRIVDYKTSPGGKHICFRQYYKDIEVLNSEIVVSINNKSKVSMVLNGYKPIQYLEVNPRVNRMDALNLAILAGNFSEPNIIEKKSKIVIYSDDNMNCHLAWMFYLSCASNLNEYLVIVDATNGNIFKFKEITLSYVTGTGKVFNPDPVTASGNLNLNGNSSELDIAPYYDIVSLSYLNEPADNKYLLRGKYAYSVGVFDPEHLVEITNLDSFLFSREENGFGEVNSYYHITKLAEYITNLGFDPRWNNEAGENTTAISFDASSYISSLPAQYKIEEERIEFYMSPPYYNTDSHEDPSIIIHEYGHALHDALMSGGLSGYMSNDTQGITEGIADYLNISYRRTLYPSYRPNHHRNWAYNRVHVTIHNPEETLPIDERWGVLDDYTKMDIWAAAIMDLEYNTATDPSSGALLGRDKTTTLQLASLAYVSDEADVFDYINAIFQAERDIYGGIDLSIIIDVFNNRGFINEVSGLITSNTIWVGFKVVSEDVTVNNGVTLTVNSYSNPVNPSTEIIFLNGAKLLVNGTLIVNGSYTKKITFDFIEKNGNGIQVNSGGTANISYANISNAAYGIYFTKAAEQ